MALRLTEGGAEVFILAKLELLEWEDLLESLPNYRAILPLVQFITTYRGSH